ncbi:transcriptional regulator [marine bacterium AO1-C]|nr:transcriptional regulator [marine bacterium AO1-C]
MKKLTKAEEQIMQILWKLKKAFVKEIIAEFPESDEQKPKYTTVATVLNVLEKKGFVAHEKFGNSNRYTPTVTEEYYSEFAVKDVMGKYFDGSLSKLVSFFVKKNKVDINELDDIMGLIEEKQQEQPDDPKNDKKTKQ